jgi:hypothetical protein
MTVLRDSRAARVCAIVCALATAAGPVSAAARTIASGLRGNAGAPVLAAPAGFLESGPALSAIAEIGLHSNLPRLAPIRPPESGPSTAVSPVSPVGAPAVSPAGVRPAARAARRFVSGDSRRRNSADAPKGESLEAFEALKALDESIEPRGPGAALGVIFDASRALKAASFVETVGPEAGEGERVRHFLKRLGFRNYTADFRSRLEKPGLTEVQRRVFALGAGRYRVFDAARDVAAAVMEGLERQGYSDEAWERAAGLAASLTELRPMEPPSRLPLPVQKGSLKEKREWLVETTARRIVYQTERVTADIVETVYSKEDWDERRTSSIAERRRALRDEVRAIRGAVETALVSLYTDVEGGGRFLGRALAAALVRRARLDNRSEREIALAAAMEARGFSLTDMVGDSFALRDRHGRNREFRVETGDVLGTRGRSRRSSEIAYGARPHWSRWWRGWREGVFGNLAGVFLKPLEKHAVRVPGQPVRNWLRGTLHAARKRMANWPMFLKSYSHVGIADVREADGVRMAWVWENEVDSGEGGIRVVSFWDQFLIKDYHARFGYARLDPAKLLAAYKAQAAEGFESYPARSSDGSWRSAMKRGEHALWSSTDDADAEEFARRLHRRAITTIQGLMMAFGLGYGWGMGDTIYKAVCSATIFLGYKLGAQFEIQSRPDMWHPLTVMFAKLGLPQAASQNLKARVYWPASFFVDEKVGEHFRVNLAGRSGGEIADDWQTVPDTRERDEARMREVRSLLAGDGEDPFPVRRRLVNEELTRALVVHRWREGDLYGGRGGLSLTRGWFRGIMRLYRGGER